MASLRRADRRADAILHDPAATRPRHPATGYLLAAPIVLAAVAAIAYAPAVFAGALGALAVVGIVEG